MFCPECGKSIPDQSKFCFECGANLKNSLGDLATGIASKTSQTGATETLSNVGTILESPQSSVSSNRYHIVCSVGQGGMGTVIQAQDNKLNRLVAIKRLNPSLSANAKAFERFVCEAKSLASLNHPNIVQVYDFDEDADGHFISMEYVEGGNLAELIKQKGKLEESEALEIIVQVCKGLTQAHDKQIIHRDIKPANILITKGGTVKITDFGIAQMAKVGDLTRTGIAIGTPIYMAPEQVVDAKHVDQRADIYSLGAMFYELLTGETPKLINLNKVPDKFKDLISKTIEPLPESRYQCIEDLLNDIENVYFQPSKTKCYKCGSENPAGFMKCCKCGHDLTTLIVSSMGRGQYSTIVEAVKHAHPYMKLLVRPGLYNETININKPLKIIGDGQQEDIVIESSDASCFVIDSKDVLLKGLKLRGFSLNNENVYKTVEVFNGKVTIENCDITSNGEAKECSALHISGKLADVTVTNCVFSDSRNVGIHCESNAKLRLEKTTIKKNIQDGVVIYDSSFIVDNCNIISNGDAGIYSVNSKGKILNTEISNNKHGVYIDDGSDIIITNTLIQDSTNTSVFATKNSIVYLENNEITRGNVGVLADKSSKCGVNKTQVKKCDVGIYAEDNCDVNVTYSRIYENKNYGIHVVNSGKMQVCECDVYDNVDQNIVVSDGGELNLIDSKIYFGENGSSQGILVDNANLLIKNSEISKCLVTGSRAINIQNSSVFNIVSCKIIENNCGIRISNSHGDIDGCWLKNKTNVLLINNSEIKSKRNFFKIEEFYQKRGHKSQRIEKSACATYTECWFEICYYGHTDLEKKYLLTKPDSDPFELESGCRLIINDCKTDLDSKYDKYRNNVGLIGKTINMMSFFKK